MVNDPGTLAADRDELPLTANRPCCAQSSQPHTAIAEKMRDRSRYRMCPTLLLLSGTVRCPLEQSVGRLLFLPLRLQFTTRPSKLDSAAVYPSSRSNGCRRSEKCSKYSKRTIEIHLGLSRPP